MVFDDDDIENGLIAYRLSSLKWCIQGSRRLLSSRICPRHDFLLSRVPSNLESFLRWDIAQGSMYRGQCTGVNAQRSMHRGQCTGVNVQRSMNRGQCTGVNVQRSMHRSQCTGVNAQGSMNRGQCTVVNAQGSMHRGQ